MNEAQDCYKEAKSSLEQAAARIAQEQENKCRQIEISQMDSGYLVQVGCKRIAVEDSFTLIHLLTKYIKNPKETTDTYFVGGIRSLLEHAL